MKRKLFAILSIFLLGFSIACQNQGQKAPKAPQTDVDADVAAIKALNDELVQLYNAEDFDKLMSVYYADNPIQMTPNVPVRRGKEAILLAYQEGSKLNIEHVDRSAVEDVRISGNLAAAWGTDTGTTTPRSGGEPVPYNLKWLVVFERQPDRAWKCIYEMWNDNPLAQPKSVSVEQELIKLEKGWNDALVKHDWAFIDQILGDDYLTTDSDGIVATKAQEMVILKTEEEAVTSVVADDFNVRVYGDTAVVAYRWTYNGQQRGKASAGRERYTDTWVRRGGKWQCVAAHASRIAKK